MAYYTFESPEVEMDSARKIYIPSPLEKQFAGKRFKVLIMPDGDIILHPISRSKDPLKTFRKVLGPLRKTVKETKKEILESAMEGL